MGMTLDLTRYRRVAYAIAYKLTGPKHRQWHDDMVQEAVLWLVSAYSQNAVTKNAEAYIRQSMKYRMIDYLRKAHDPRVVSYGDACALGFKHVIDRLGVLPNGPRGPLRIGRRTRA